MYIGLHKITGTLAHLAISLALTDSINTSTSKNIDDILPNPTTKEKNNTITDVILSSLGLFPDSDVLFIKPICRYYLDKNGYENLSAETSTVIQALQDNPEQLYDFSLWNHRSYWTHGLPGLAIAATLGAVIGGLTAKDDKKKAMLHGAKMGLILDASHMMIDVLQYGKTPITKYLSLDAGLSKNQSIWMNLGLVITSTLYLCRAPISRYIENLPLKRYINNYKI